MLSFLSRPSLAAGRGHFFRSLRRAVAGLGLVALVLGGVVRAQNLATNPGFEAGNTTGWFAFGPPAISAQTSQVRSGTYAALVQNRTDTWNGIAQSLQSVLVPGQTYQISAWVRLVSGGSQTVQLTMQKADVGGTTYTAIAAGSVSSANWTQLSGDYTHTVSGTLTTLNFYVEVPSSGTAAFYLDDVSVTAAGGSGGGVPGQCTVNWTNVFQQIDGFGASSAWRSTWNTAQADLFFSTNTGIGLSLLRTRISPTGTTVETGIAQMAQARGAKVWSAPWSPPTSLKSTNANGVISVNGGAFVGNAANYQAYANQLAGYVATMKNTHGVNLYAISIQNEPNHNTTNYESCVWTGQQFREFIPYLSAALAASNVATTKIMLPESIGWATTSLHTPSMNDPAVAPLVGIIANHNYDGPNFQTGATSPPAALNNYGKSLWQTEVSTGDPYDGGISNAVYWAGRIHQFMTVAQAHAWHYWWLVPLDADNQGLTDPAVNPAKRMYALGQFARFVRPGFQRIGIGSPTGPLQISAYKEAASGALAIVAINPTTNTVAQTFNLSGFGLTNVTPWITSATLSLAAQPPVAVTGTAFTNLIPPLSIVTLVGRAQSANAAPTDIALSNATVAENQAPGTIVGAFSTTDPDAGNTFTYTLVGGTGSTGNGAFSIVGSNLLTAASFNYEAQNSYSVRVRSTDQGGLFVEKAFVIAVTDVNEPPSLAAISDLTTGAGVSLSITNFASDPDLPPQSLQFSLLAGPAGAALNPTNGLFTWRPSVSQAGTTNPVTVKVTDNSEPPRSATNSFTVFVNPLTPSAISAFGLAGGQPVLTVDGTQGPDYTVLTSTNLLNWQPLFTTNAPVVPVTFTLPVNATNRAAFFRVEMGP